MHGHAETTGAFAAALRGADPAPGLFAGPQDDIARRLAVYRNNVAVSLSDALSRRFPVVERLVGPAFFGPLARAFIATDLPQSPVLADWGAGFGDFLDGFPPLARWPFLGDVARIEHARGQAFHAADATPITGTVLAQADPASLRLALHPSVRVLSLAHPAVSIWTANQPGGDGRSTAQGPEIALILRRPGFDVPVAAIDAGDAALIAALGRGATLLQAAAEATAARPGHSAAPILIHLMQAGALLPHAGDTP